MSASQQPANLADMVRIRAKTRGNAIAFEFEGRQTSFAEFANHLRQDFAPASGRSLLGGQGTAGELTQVKRIAMPHPKMSSPAKADDPVFHSLRDSCMAVITGYSALAEHDGFY
jgi:hypothetical protein